VGHLGAEAILHLREQWRVGLRKQAFSQLCAVSSPQERDFERNRDVTTTTWQG